MIGVAVGNAALSFTTVTSSHRRRTTVGAWIAAAILAACSAVVSPSVSLRPSAQTPASASLTTQWTGAARPTAGMSVEERAAIDSAALEALADHGDGATALYIGIWDPVRGVYLRAYGEASPGVPATLGDHNRIGSVTKTFTAVAVLQLVADGRIGLSDTLASVLPELSARFPAIAPLTVDQLLGMRTGIGDFFGLNSFSEAFYADRAHVFTIEDIVAVALEMRLPPAVAPSAAEYSNTNYVILGEILRVVSGRAANVVITDLARSAGLKDTALQAPEDRRLPAPAAHGYVGPRYIADHGELLPSGTLDGTDVSDWIPFGAGPAGGMYSTVEDLAAWAASGYGSSLLPIELANARLATPSGADWDYGYGIMRVGDWIGHGGSVDGWVIDSAYNMATGAAWVMIVNSSGGDGVLQAIAQFLPDRPF